MKYYLIVGEASGDLHASNLMRALKEKDSEADFRFFGGDLMSAVGGTRVKHYKELAYMGFIPVLLHLRTIFKNMDRCKADIVEWNPDVVILVDYPGFNLKIAEYVKKHTSIPVYYYISPKIWAWKEYRIKNIKRDVDELFSTSFGIYLPEGKARTITFRTSESEARFLRDLPLHRSQEEIKREDEMVTFSIFVCPDRNLIMEFCKYGSRIEVLSPADIREDVAEELRKAAEKYR